MYLLKIVLQFLIIGRKVVLLRKGARVVERLKYASQFSNTISPNKEFVRMAHTDPQYLSALSLLIL